MAHDAQIPSFTIVTPSFNSGRFIGATIASVVSQSGRFRLRYHVQDGGSTDDTVAELQRWTERLSSSEVQFSYSVAPDRGMYDAIRAGFDQCGIKPGGYMTWLNADDILMPGALACAAKLFREFPEVALMGGTPCQIDEDGVIVRIHEAQIYPRSTLMAGLHDGRHLPFVMQEGAFWKSELWLTTGGVNPDFRLAGDFDLWRRFAAETAYVTVDTILAAHRRHSGQLTESPVAYYAELDASIEAHLDQRDREWERYKQWRERSAGDREESFLGAWLSWANGFWELTQRPLPALFNTTIHLSSDGVGRSLPARYIAGFSDETAPPYPFPGVPRGSRWLQDSIGILQFQAPAAGPYRVRIRVRSFSDQVVLTVKHSACGHQTRHLFERRLPVTRFDRDCEISADASFVDGINTVSLFVDPVQAEHRKEFLIIVCEAAPV